ncbi:hypothetical protein M0805_009377 [Coniferiporia weirii]|nr:hypothetical protein M0805_009377 [Coniferiporia weirii]
MASRRPSNPRARSPARQQPHSKPAELVTYRLDNEMVYVSPASDFDEALSYAQKVFPQLAGIARERIAFSVNVRVGGALRAVRIAPMAWERVLKSLATYEIVDLSVLPLASSSRAAKSDTCVHNVHSTPDLYASGGGSDPDCPPPMYGAELQLRDSEKSPLFTLSPPTPAIKRCSSALGGWLGLKHL